jgi:hypothetical protein
VCRYILPFPSNKTSTGHRQKLQLASRIDELCGLVWEPLDAKGVLVDAGEELEAPVLLRR